MPEALGGALPSPAGISARVLASSVEVEMPGSRSSRSAGCSWRLVRRSCSPPGTDAHSRGRCGRVDLAATGGAPVATLASGEWTVFRVGLEARGRSGTTSLPLF